MKNYTITVNGTVYEVSVEEGGGGSAPVRAAAPKAAAGAAGTGAIEAAKEANKYAIGVDRDQSDLAPENVLTSAVKKLNVASYDLVKDLVEGTFKGGAEKVYGLKEGGVGIVENTKNLIPQDVMDYVNKEANKVKNGEIKIPKTEEEYNQLIK